MSDSRLPVLPEDWEPTRASLHSYARGVGAIPRVHAPEHPQWWHISLNVRPYGLVTDTMRLPDGGTFDIKVDLRGHEVVVEASSGDGAALSMTEGLTGTQFANALVKIVADLGLDGEYVRDKFENDDPREYDPSAAELFLDALVTVHDVFAEHRSSLEGDMGPLQVWPHGFDLAFESHGTRTVPYGDEMLPSQLNLGWYPAGDAYFYSNPWPFEGELLTSHQLPHGAVWHTEGWEGTMLTYDKVAGDPDGARKVLDYARAVYDVAAPTLMA